VDYCKSSSECQRFSKGCVPKAPLVTRKPMAESLAFDIVRPFPIAKGGYKFLGGWKPSL